MIMSELQNVLDAFETCKTKQQYANVIGRLNILDSIIQKNIVMPIVGQNLSKNVCELHQVSTFLQSYVLECCKKVMIYKMIFVLMIINLKYVRKLLN